MPRRIKAFGGDECWNAFHGPTGKVNYELVRRRAQTAPAYKAGDDSDRDAGIIPGVRGAVSIDFGKTPGGRGAGMGGFGSGNWYRWNARKSTVEESLVLAMREFRKLLYPHAAGTFFGPGPAAASLPLAGLLRWATCRR